MGKTITAIATLVFATSASAASDAEIYHGFAEGNEDLTTEIQGGNVAHSTQSSNASGFDWYNGFADNNPDLYPFGVEGTPVAIGVQPGIGDSINRDDRETFRHNDIYGGFGRDNQDL